MNLLVLINNYVLIVAGAGFQLNIHKDTIIGETVILPCENKQGTDLVQWTRRDKNTEKSFTTVYTDGWRINPRLQLHERLKIVGGRGRQDYGLQISNVTMMDSGLYRCAVDTISNLTYYYVTLDVKDETFLQTSVVGVVEIGKDFILNCTCEGVCSGNQKWTGGPSDIELAYNGRVNIDMKDKINIIKNSSGEYSIKVLNAKYSDISNYTCGIGFATKQINRTELIQHSPTQSPTVTSTPQQPNKSNTCVLVGIVIGVLLLVVVVVIALVLVKRKYDRHRTNRPNVLMEYRDQL